MNTIDRIADLSQIWKQAAQVFPYFDQNRIDWDQAYADYLPKVMAAQSERAYHLLLAEFMNLLGDGHTDYQPPRALQDENGYLPFTLRYVGGEYCVDAVTTGQERFLGARALRLNGAPFAEAIAWACRYAYHVGDYVSRYRLHQLLPFYLQRTGNCLETDQGAWHFDLLPQRQNKLSVKPLALNESYQKIAVPRLDIRLYDGGILYVRLDDFLYAQAADEVRQALTQHPDARGLIVDIRENIGGMTLYGARVAELLIPGVFHGCQKRTRSMTGVALASASQLAGWSAKDIERDIVSGLTTREEVTRSRALLGNAHFDEYEDCFGAEGQAALYDGPCLLLTSRHTVSAAEDFAAMLRSNRRALTLGTPTCGTTGTPLLQRLRCGGSMRVCSVAYRLLDGTEFIGRGIAPDAECEISADDLRAGTDSVLREALRRLREA